MDNHQFVSNHVLMKVQIIKVNSLRKWENLPHLHRRILQLCHINYPNYFGCNQIYECVSRC